MTATTPVSARDWVDRASVDPAVVARWPDYRVIVVATDTADVARLTEVTDRLFAEAHTAARRVDPAGADEHIARWHQAYRDFGVKPRVARVSVDALTRRAATSDGLPRINTLVDLYNAVSILHRVPIGGEDLDRYDGPARLVLANGDEPFHTVVDGEAVLARATGGEPIWRDDTGVTCRRWNWRQTTRTAIGERTTRMGFIVDSLDAPHHEGARRAAQQLAELVAPTHTRSVGGATGHEPIGW